MAGLRRLVTSDFCRVRNLQGSLVHDLLASWWVAHKRHDLPSPRGRPSLSQSTLLALVAIFALAIAFDYINGFHDTANAIATSVATRAVWSCRFAGPVSARLALSVAALPRVDSVRFWRACELQPAFSSAAIDVRRSWSERCGN